jgi:hypothetical protein
MSTYAYPRGQCPEDLQQFISDRHAQGLLDTEITEQWNAANPGRTIGRRNLCYVRRSLLGLPVNAERRQDVRRLAQRRQMEVLGVTRFADVAKRARRRAAMRAGWPVDLRPAELRILAVMEDGEHRTRTEIAAAVGERGDARHWFKCKYGSQSALANLVSRGLLRRSRLRMRRVGGKGCSQHEYWMPLDVLASRKNRQGAKNVAGSA